MLPISDDAAVYVQIYERKQECSLGYRASTTLLKALEGLLLVLPKVLMRVLLGSSLSCLFFLHSLTLVLELLMNELQSLERHHRRNCGRNSADHVCAHSVVESSPAFFL